MSVAAAPATESAEPILRLRGVGRRFGGLQAVSAVDLDVRPGERRAILGPNGAGKTTLFNVIAGEFPPTSGTIELYGVDVTFAAGPPASRAGPDAHLPDLATLPRPVGRGQPLPVARRQARVGICGPSCMRAPRRPPARGRPRDRRRVGLEPVTGELVKNLSHGEQRQLEVGMALAGEPRLMMLDEPAAGLSRTERLKLTEMLIGLDRSITLLLIEHDMDVALTVAEYVTMMHDGHVIVEGTPAEIRANELVHDLYLGKGHYDDE